MKISIDYIARVEGEGSVKFEIEEGKLKNLKLNIWEPPRFFEGFLVGRRFDEVPDIVSRICGICPVSHMSTAIYAIEEAIGFKPSEEIEQLRTIMALSQIAASHLVHIYMLVMPDYYKAELLSGHENKINGLLKLKEAVNNVTALFGGRALHPVSMTIGGFTKVPLRDDVERIIKGLESVKEDAINTVIMLSELKFPDLKNNTEYIAIDRNDTYAVNDGYIASNFGLRADVEDYCNYFLEEEVQYSNAKRTMLKGKGSIMVGALARLNIKFDKLHPEAKRIARVIGFETPTNNPFFNIISQSIEIIHSIWKCIELLEGLTYKDYFMNIKPNEGSGAAATEAPRGMLYHQYELNRRGIIEKANIVTPTAHNFMSLEESLGKLIKENIEKHKEELSLLCEMLVRAYDPCFSCSVH
jgi:coenzyme F420-reducing hydrogenase alpha subunit